MYFGTETPEPNVLALPWERRAMIGSSFPQICKLKEKTIEKHFIKKKLPQVGHRRPRVGHMVGHRVGHEVGHGFMLLANTIG